MAITALYGLYIARGQLRRKSPFLSRIAVLIVPFIMRRLLLSGAVEGTARGTGWFGGALSGLRRWRHVFLCFVGSF